MANTVISLKKSATPSATPSALANGELAINYADGKLFYKAANGTIVEFATGIDSSDFGTVNVGGTLLVSDVQGDILTITAGDNIVLTPDAGGDSFSIAADLSGATDYANSTFLANTTGTFDGDLTVTGNVGIGTTTPSSPLVIDQGNRTNIPSLRLINLGAGATGIDIGPLSIGDNSGNEIQYDVPNKRLAYRVRGNLGGGSYPAHDFTIDATASPSFDSVMRIYSPASGADLLNIVTGSGEIFTVQYDGNVGIGITSPNYKLDVNGSVNASALLVNGSPISGGGGAYFSGNNGDTGDATGLGDIFRVHSNTLSQNVTIYSGNNALAAGPITVDSGKSITIQTGARMVIA